MSTIAELVVRNLPLIRGGRLLQPEITFSVPAGEILTIHGPNGAGKTSLLRAIAGLLEVPDGCVKFRMYRGEMIATPEERLGKTGWFGHQDGVKRQLSTLENLEFHRWYNRSEGSAEEALATFGLGHLRDLPAQYLSHGQRRRLAFARLFIVPRSLWLLDEPLSAIDSKGKECIRQHIRQHSDNGGIVVAAMHEPLGLMSATVELE